MAFVITTGCCNDASCVDVCPADCIRPHPDDPEFRTAEQLYIDPRSCIDCSACMFACPVGAIHDGISLPDELSEFLAINRDHFVDHPLIPRFIGAPATSSPKPLNVRIAVIGAGPSGCYAAAELSAVPGVHVTVFDRLPTPFGLVRSGVAPDHPDTKLVDDHFQQVLERDTVICYFNVDVGTDITVGELRESHHAVVYAGGAADDRRLNVGGENLVGSHAAREFVAWYNGHPESADDTFDLSGPTAVVLGNGNVALDVARILARPAAALFATDIADHALQGLQGSNIREVVIAARRGPADAACTYAELLQLTQTPGVRVRTLGHEVATEPSRVLTRPERRKLDLFRALADDDDVEPPGIRRITFRFGVKPTELGGHDAVETLSLRRADRHEAPLEVIETGLVLRAIGYAVRPVTGLPLDPAGDTLAHVGGRLVDEDSGQVLDGLYCVGWAKRGGSGVIGTNRTCAHETVGAVLEDLRSGRLAEPSMSPTGLADLLHARQPDRVDLAGWKRIDDQERSDGRSSAPHRPRRKIVRIDSMLAVAAVPHRGDS